MKWPEIISPNFGPRKWHSANSPHPVITSLKPAFRWFLEEAKKEVPTLYRLRRLQEACCYGLLVA